MEWYKELLEETNRVEKLLSNGIIHKYISSDNPELKVIVGDIFECIKNELYAIIDGWSLYYITDENTFIDKVSDDLIKTIADNRGVSEAYVNNILNKIKSLYK